MNIIRPNNQPRGKWLSSLPPPLPRLPNVTPLPPSARARTSHQMSATPNRVYLHPAEKT